MFRDGELFRPAVIINGEKMRAARDYHAEKLSEITKRLQVDDTLSRWRRKARMACREMSDNGK